MGGLGVQAHEGLVQHQQAGRVDKGRDQGQLLLHAMGIAGNGIAQRVLQLQGAGGPLDTPAAVGLGYGKNIGDKGQILDTRQVIVEIGIVRDIGKAGLGGYRIAGQVNPINEDLARIIALRADQAFDGRSLSGPVVADKAEDIARLHAKGEVAHRGLTAGIGLGQVGDLKHDGHSFLAGNPPSALLSGPRGCGGRGRNRQPAAV